MNIFTTNLLNLDNDVPDQLILLENEAISNTASLLLQAQKEDYCGMDAPSTPQPVILPPPPSPSSVYPLTSVSPIRESPPALPLCPEPVSLPFVSGIQEALASVSFEKEEQSPTTPVADASQNAEEDAKFIKTGTRARKAPPVLWSLRNRRLWDAFRCRLIKLGFKPEDCRPQPPEPAPKTSLVNSTRLDSESVEEIPVKKTKRVNFSHNEPEIFILDGKPTKIAKKEVKKKSAPRCLKKFI